MDMAQKPILGLQNISKITICGTFTLELRGWSVHLLQPNFLKSTKLASLISAHLCHIIHFHIFKIQNLGSGSTDLLEVFNGLADGAAEGGPVVFSQG